ncbi:MAG TPA: DUF438 domain-containing protein [Spirochaetia bacterium]|nr:DUF438 domain-containing protein [Spirochaetia bacterium]
MDSGKKAIVKDVIRGLHAGLGVEQAKERILRDVGLLSSGEITEIEQSLIDEGVPPEEIKAFCNVHALLFESSLAQTLAPEKSPSHPLTILRNENRAIQRILETLKQSLEADTFAQALAGTKAALKELKGLDRHYSLKENAIFPFLEKHGFSGPSKVMWAKDNDVRELLRGAESALASVKDAQGLLAVRQSFLDKLIEEAQGMIFKEENILFPASQEKLEPGEWVRVLESFGQIGPAYAELSDIEVPLAELGQVRQEAALSSGGLVELGNAKLSVGQLEAILNTLPVDISFVDAQDKVRYFNRARDRIFPRSDSVIGRSVQNCHPPQSVHRVNAILDAFRGGKRETAEFWITVDGKFVSIRYFAVRSTRGEYLGCLEVCQDLTKLRVLKGERRLLDDAP